MGVLYLEAGRGHLHRFQIFNCEETKPRRSLRYAKDFFASRSGSMLALTRWNP
jgi:hypothetical protein